MVCTMCLNRPAVTAFLCRINAIIPQNKLEFTQTYGTVYRQRLYFHMLTTAVCFPGEESAAEGADESVQDCDHLMHANVLL